jgi:muramoyltetrapeptide carboxypeptidase
MKVAVVAPARRIEPVVAPKVQALAALIAPSLDIVFHPQCFLESGHFAGTDAERAAALLEVANDPSVGAVWFARGGYGSNRVLAEVMPKLRAAAKAKTYMGYSDMGFLLGALYARRIGRAVHGPMPIDIGGADSGARVARALLWLERQDRGGLETGLGGRPHAAFNLAILTAMLGTPYLPDLTDHVLIVEEVSEPLYRIDRMLFQLAHATQLKGIAGLKLGQVTDVQANDPPFGETPEQMVARWAGEMGVPYLGRAEVGHYAGNRVVPFGLA